MLRQWLGGKDRIIPENLRTKIKKKNILRARKNPSHNSHSGVLAVFSPTALVTLMS